MARCLIIGCGCRGLSLAAALRSDGHAVRATTRDPRRETALRDAGVEPFLGDPDRVATIARAFDRVGVACLLLGSAQGTADALRALHTTRLDMLLERMLDTTSRGIVYEATGSVDAELLALGTARVRRACERSLIPYALIDADPDDHAAWTEQAHAAVTDVLLAGAQPPG